MKKLILIGILILSSCAFAEIPKPTDDQQEIFTTICYSWLEKNWQTVKHFEDGDVLYQPIHKMELVRVENDVVLLTGGNFVESDTEIYHIAIYFTAEYAENKVKKSMLQVLYLHIRNGRIVETDWSAAIPYNKI